MARLKAALALPILSLQSALAQQYQLIQAYNASNIFDEFHFFTVRISRIHLAKCIMIIRRVLIQQAAMWNTYPTTLPPLQALFAMARTSFTSALTRPTSTHLMVRVDPVYA